MSDMTGLMASCKASCEVCLEIQNLDQSTEYVAGSSSIRGTWSSVEVLSLPPPVGLQFPKLKVLPSVRPTFLQSSSPSRGCYDNPLYHGVFGLTCEMLKGIFCKDLARVGFSMAEMNGALVHCKESCGLCSEQHQYNQISNTRSYSSLNTGILPSADPCTMNMALPSMAPILLPCNSQNSLSNFSSRAKKKTRRTCHDDPVYSGKFGLLCNKFERISCEKAELAGFTKLEVIHLLKSCKESCGLC
uniref:ShKT domain-containing protein n=1 Tax=Corethron hystrix TaxID=216773 RepID=A0A7S1FR66_9STRA